MKLKRVPQQKPTQSKEKMIMKIGAFVQKLSYVWSYMHGHILKIGANEFVGSLFEKKYILHSLEKNV